MRAANVVQLGLKELWSLARDPIMLLLIVFVFTVSVYAGPRCCRNRCTQPRLRSWMKTTRSSQSASLMRSSRPTSCHLS